MGTRTPHNPGPGDHREPELVPFTFDLTRHEMRRLAAILATVPDWDPTVALSEENEAYRLLCSGLDADQLATFEMLRGEGVLDVRP